MRTAEIKRTTTETDISLKLTLDAGGKKPAPVSARAFKFQTTWNR